MNASGAIRKASRQCTSQSSHLPFPRFDVCVCNGTGTDPPDRYATLLAALSDKWDLIWVEELVKNRTVTVGTMWEEWEGRTVMWFTSHVVSKAASRHWTGWRVATWQRKRSCTHWRSGTCPSIISYPCVRITTKSQKSGLDQQLRRGTDESIKTKVVLKKWKR